MKPFRYEVADDASAAVAVAARSPGAMYLAGGTNLVDLMKLGVAAPDLLVDVSRLPLDHIEPTAAGGLLVGAAVRNSELAADPHV
ncbi:MAG TPA: FAD binding domain-containing protein, partial [Acidimicrobiales bacterium]